MIITIEVDDEGSIDGTKAAGARDICEHFLPMIGIKASSVTLHEITPEEMAKRRAGKIFTYYEDAYPTGARETNNV